MRNIKVALWLILATLAVSWLMADTLLPEPFTYFSFRAVFIQFSGVLAMGAMSIAMLLAVRPLWIERALNGLDKSYRLHKWLGISALIFAVLHWWWAQGTKWMVGWGWLVRQERKRGGGEPLTQIEQWLRTQKAFAESVGEWAFYAAVLLIALALIRKFPYHLFKKTHKWLALSYLVLVYHTVILFKTHNWAAPIGLITAALLLGGSFAALLVLTGRVGRKLQVKGVIKSLTTYPGVKVIEGSIQLEDGWRGHEPGQFAFVTSSRSEGAHPYTIASAWDPGERCLTFVVKELGDWTARLHNQLEEGMPVTVEGPYGCFNFKDSPSRQIWIGAGIGITPFIAKMKQLAQIPGPKEIDLFHVTTDYDQTAIDKLTRDAQAADIRLHLTITPQDGRLTPEQIRAAAPEWRSSSIWFCGPGAFGRDLRKDFLQQGVSTVHYHQELFEMR